MGVQSKGLPYFLLDCTLDIKFELIEAEFGLKGFAVIVKLFQRIYGIQGYYCEWDSEVVLLFSKQLNEGRNVVSDIVNRAVERDLFDRHQFEQNGILTSKGIQERFFNATARRKKVYVREEYLMLSVDNLPSNVSIIRKNVYISKENDNISEQRREEKRRGEKTKEEKIIEPVDTEEKINPISDAIQVYAENIDPAYTPREYELLRSFVEDNGMDEQLLIAVINTAVDNNAKSINYIRAIVKNLNKENIKTVEQFNARNKHFKNRKNTGNKRKSFRTEEQRADQQKIDDELMSMSLNKIIEHSKMAGAEDE